jgi:hypothetical protein
MLPGKSPAMASCVYGCAPLLLQIGKRIVVTRPAYLEVTTLPDKQATLRLLAFPLFVSHTSTRDLKSYIGNCRYDLARSLRHTFQH